MLTKINERITKKEMSMERLTSILKTKIVSRKAQENIYPRLIRPVALYACDPGMENAS